MRRTMLLVALLAVTGLACTPGAVETGDYTATMLLLPEGQPEAGRSAFIALGCAACHAVAWDSSLPAPMAAVPAPELGVDVAKLGPGGIASSIVAPSHKVADKFKGEGEVSPMRDFNSQMTIRQLSDIVAYLKRQGLETQARTGVAPG